MTVISSPSKEILLLIKLSEYPFKQNNNVQEIETEAKGWPEFSSSKCFFSYLIQVAIVQKRLSKFL